MSFSRASVRIKCTLGRTSRDRFHENLHTTTYCRKLKVLLIDCCHDFLFRILVWKDMLFTRVVLCSRECLVKPTRYFLRHFQYFSRYVIPLFCPLWIPLVWFIIFFFNCVAGYWTNASVICKLLSVDISTKMILHICC